MASIPSIDLSISSEERHHEISKAIQDLGFLSLKSPKSPSKSEVDRIFDISQRFFEEESLTEKEKAAITTENKGWVKVRQEVLDVENHPNGDIKEAFNLHVFSDGKPVQQLPPLLAAHIPELETFIRSCHALGVRLLESFAVNMGLKADYFTSRHKYEAEHSSALRLLYYPPNHDSKSVSLKDKEDIRAGAHSDYGSLTLLFQKELGGLQILLSSLKPNSPSQWLDVPVVDDAVLVNIGDAFDFWTAGKFKSTLHRVIAPPDGDESRPRLSMAYFMQPADSELLVRILADDDNKSPIQRAYDRQSVVDRFGVEPDAKLTAKEWLQRRLSATYKARKDV